MPRTALGQVQIRKILMAFLCCWLGFAGCTSVCGQSIVGKWKRTATKIFVTDPSSGKQVPATPAVQAQYDQHAADYHESLEFKDNNEYIITTTTSVDPKPKAHTGNYTLSGSDLDMKIPLINSQRPTITIKSMSTSAMTWSFLYMGKLMEITYTKI
jgi:hypothetical protein